MERQKNSNKAKLKNFKQSYDPISLHMISLGDNEANWRIGQNKCDDDV
jgi:hypothetical protein